MLIPSSCIFSQSASGISLLLPPRLLVHTVRGTAADVGDIAEGYRCALTQQNAADALIDQGEKLDTAVSAKANSG